MRFQRILIAPDSFKGSLSAVRVADAIMTGLSSSAPDLQVTCLPMSDGGEGAGEVVESLGAKRVQAPTASVYGVPRDGYWLRWNRVALVESSVGSGYVPPNERVAPAEHTTSLGTGLLVSAALQDPDIDSVYVALGGTGCTDGGMGFLAGLGAKFFDASGVLLQPYGKNLGKVRRWSPPPRLLKPLIGLYDVGVPLLGDHGAVHLFGPQKGLDSLEEVESAMGHYAFCLDGRKPQRYMMPGAGAAGGIGFGVLVAGGTLSGGAEMIGEWCELSDTIARSDLVITGEGRIDAQTLHGKVVGYVVQVAAQHNKPVIAIVGSRSRDLWALHNEGLSFVMPIPTGPMQLDHAINQSEQLTAIVGEELGWLVSTLNANVM